MSTWRDAIIKARKDSAKPPPGYVAIDAIAEDMGVLKDQARQEVNRLISMGRAERIHGKAVNNAGSIASTFYYRLISPKKTEAAAATAKKKRSR